MVSGVASVTEGILSDPGRGGIKAEVGRTGAGSHDKGDEATSPAGMSSDTGAHAPELMIDGMYTCPRPECKRIFSLKAALHTHIGWHKRKDNQASGVYERKPHRSKTTVYRKDPTSGEMIASDVFRCDEEGCNKTFKTRGALSTHQGHHKRKRVQRHCPTAKGSGDRTSGGNKSHRPNIPCSSQQLVVVEVEAAPQARVTQRPENAISVEVQQASVPMPWPYAARNQNESVASHALPVGQFGSPIQTASATPSRNPLGALPTPTTYMYSGDLAAWANCSQHFVGAGHTGQGISSTNNAGTSEEVEICLPSSPLAAPPPHVSIPVRESESVLYPGYGITL